MSFKSILFVSEMPESKSKTADEAEDSEDSDLDLRSIVENFALLSTIINRRFGKKNSTPNLNLIITKLTNISEGVRISLIMAE